MVHKQAPPSFSNAEIDVSVVIPCASSDLKYLLELIPIINSLRHEVCEVIIIINGCESLKLPLIDFNDDITVHYVRQYLMPGAARNYGYSFVKTDYVAFLDVKTVPPSDWISSSKRLILESKNFCGLLGQVIYCAPTFMSNCFLLATYGLRPLFCIPGSVLHRETMRSVGHFLPHARAAEDVEWMQRANSMGFSLYNGSGQIIYYYIDSPLRFSDVLAKWYRNYRASASIPNVYYVQKTIYFLFASVLFLMTALVWNWQIADWNEASIFYIPYVVRTALFALLFSYYIIRGLLMPLRKGAEFDYLFPLVSFVVLTFSIILDTVKLFAFISSLFARDSHSLPSINIIDPRT